MHFLSRQLMKKGKVNTTPLPLSFCDSHCYADAYELHILISCEAGRYSSYFIDLKSQIVVGVFCLFLFPFFKLSQLLNKKGLIFN